MKYQTLKKDVSKLMRLCKIGVIFLTIRMERGHVSAAAYKQ
jgi:hypothetical protein